MVCGVVLVLSDCVHREMDPLSDAGSAVALGDEGESGPVVRERPPGCEIESKEVGRFTEQGDTAIVAVDLETWRSELVEEREIEALHRRHAHSRCIGIVS